MDDYYTQIEKEWRISELVRIVDGFDLSVSNMLNNSDIKEKQDYTCIVVRTAGKSIVTMREILSLVANGFPDGALSLARNLYEQLIILLFFALKSKTPEMDAYVSDYFLSAEIEWLIKHKYELEIRDKTDEADKTQKEIDALKETTDRKVSGNYWWSGYYRFNDLSDYVTENYSPDLGDMLHLLKEGYYRACVSLHANCLGNFMRLGTDDDFAGIYTGPRIKGHELPLWMATSSFISIVGVTCNNLGIANTFNQPLNELAIHYIRKMHNVNS